VRQKTVYLQYSTRQEIGGFGGGGGGGGGGGDSSGGSVILIIMDNIHVGPWHGWGLGTCTAVLTQQLWGYVAALPGYYTNSSVL
jgi:hypothetical protein